MTPTPALVLYAEVANFYVEAERVRSPELQGRALLVGGDPRKRGQVQAGSHEALSLGVTAGMSMLEAIERCPGARAVRTDMKYYREMSGRLRACLREQVEALETLGLEGVFTELQGASARGAAPEALAEGLRASVQAALSLPLRVGLASVKFLAKLAAEESGESGVGRIDRGSEADFLRPLPVNRLPSVGPRTVATLATLGVRKVGDLLDVPTATLEECLGNHGLRIQEFARGEDSAPVRRAVHPQSVSREVTLDEAEVDGAVLTERLQALALALESALLREGLSASRVVLKVRYDDQEMMTRSLTLRRKRLASAAEIAAAARDLLDRTHAGRRPIGLLGLRLGGLSSGAPREDGIRQLDLFRDA